MTEHTQQTTTTKNQCCPTDMSAFCRSGYIQTTCGTGTSTEDECKELGWDDCCATTMCLPIKFPLTLPCFIGSMINGCINKLKSTTEKNYLF